MKIVSRTGVQQYKRATQQRNEEAVCPPYGPEYQSQTHVRCCSSGTETDRIYYYLCRRHPLTSDSDWRTDRAKKLHCGSRRVGMAIHLTGLGARAMALFEFEERIQQPLEGRSFLLLLFAPIQIWPVTVTKSKLEGGWSETIPDSRKLPTDLLWVRGRRASERIQLGAAIIQYARWMEGIGLCIITTEKSITTIRNPIECVLDFESFAL